MIQRRSYCTEEGLDYPACRVLRCGETYTPMSLFQVPTVPLCYHCNGRSLMGKRAREILKGIIILPIASSVE